MVAVILKKVIRIVRSNVIYIPIESRRRFRKIDVNYELPIDETL